MLLRHSGPGHFLPQAAPGWAHIPMVCAQGVHDQERGRRKAGVAQPHSRPLPTARKVRRKIAPLGWPRHGELPLELGSLFSGSQFDQGEKGTQSRERGRLARVSGSASVGDRSLTPRPHCSPEAVFWSALPHLGRGRLGPRPPGKHLALPGSRPLTHPSKCASASCRRGERRERRW